MSLTNALGSARSGLGATSIQADTIARNISNANTPGFTRKSAELVTIPNGGVYVSSIDRQVDTMLSRLDRGNVSRLAAERTVADGMKVYTSHLGQPEDAMSPVAGMARMKEALITLSLGVSSRAGQMAVVSTGRELASNLNRLSDTLSSVQSEVEMNIRYDVADLNKALYGIAALNKRIVAQPGDGMSMADMKDEMDGLLQKVSEIMDIQAVTDSSGMVSVMSTGGVELVMDTDVQEVTYDSSTGRLAAGDVTMTPGGNNRSFSAGSLHGLFTLRNDIIPTWSSDLDTMAAALVEGFQREAPFADGRGLFTDGGQAYDPAAIDGLARRIRINADADQDQGGDPSLVQSGGDPARAAGDVSVVDAMIRLFESPVQITGRPFGDSQGLTRMGASIVSAHQQARAQAERRAETTATESATVRASRENLQGVNVDDELQKLMLVQQSYAANAKVLTTVSSMMDTLLQAV